MWGAAIGGAANAYAGLAMQQFQSRLREQEAQNAEARQLRLMERQEELRRETARQGRVGTLHGGIIPDADSGKYRAFRTGEDGTSISLQDIGDMSEGQRQGLLAQRQAEQQKAQQELSNLSALEKQRLAAATNQRAQAGAASQRGSYYGARTDTERMTQDGTLPAVPTSTQPRPPSPQAVISAEKRAEEVVAREMDVKDRDGKFKTGVTESQKSEYNRRVQQETARLLGQADPTNPMGLTR